MNKTLIFMIFSLLLVGSAVAAPNFQIESVSCGGGLFGTISWAAVAGSEVDCDVTVVNTGTSGAMRVEVGILQQSLVEEWYGTASFGLFNPGTDVPNCVPSETFTDTRLLELGGGGRETMDFDLTAPNNWFEQYVIHVATYDECWSTGMDTGQTDFFVRSFDVTESVGSGTPTASCSDGLKNQDETDLDCGGSCGQCPDYYRCSIDADCFGSATCSAVEGVNRCVPAGATPPPSNNDGSGSTIVDVVQDNGRVIVLILAVIAIVAIMFWPSGKRRR